MSIVFDRITEDLVDMPAVRVKELLRPLNLGRWRFFRYLNRVYARWFIPNHGDIWLKMLTRRIVRPGDVVVDVGANEGLVSLAAASVGAMVYAFEPNEELCQRLRGENIVAYQAALFSESMRHVFTVVDGRSGLSSLEFSAAARAKEELIPDLRGKAKLRATVVETKRLDEYRLPRLHLLKIDAQGADYDVLLGAEDTVRRCRPVILVEVWPPGLGAFGRSPADISEYLHRHGYRMLTLHSDDTAWDVLAIPEDTP